jgi:hypothetical protein
MVRRIDVASLRPERLEPMAGVWVGPDVYRSEEPWSNECLWNLASRTVVVPSRRYAAYVACFGSEEMQNWNQVRQFFVQELRRQGEDGEDGEVDWENDSTYSLSQPNVGLLRPRYRAPDLQRLTIDLNDVQSVVIEMTNCFLDVEHIELVHAEVLRRWRSSPRRRSS